MKTPANNIIKHMKKKAGQPPGNLEYTSNEETEKTKVSLLSFSESFYQNIVVEDIGKINDLINNDAVHWIMVTGLSDTALIENLGNSLNIQLLLLEDVMNVEHLPKAEESDDHLFFTLNILAAKEGNGEIGKNHISFILGSNYLVTFAQKSTDIFNPIITRIEQSVGKARQRKSDYLLYRLTDIIIDHYFLLFINFDEQLEVMEDELMHNEASDLVRKIQVLKKDLIYLKRNIFPVYESIRLIQKSDGKFIKKQTHNYINDTADHLNQLVQTIEGYRESLTNLMELQMANNSNRMNNVMKTLTVIATIFIPLTFLAGIYGMNFDYMPELRIKWAYPAFLALVTVLGLGMWFYMKRKKWF